MNKVLIVVDAQEDFTRGALRNEQAIEALPRIGEIVRHAEGHGFHIIYTRDTHAKEDYLQTQEGRNLPVLHCIRGTGGRALCSEVQASADYLLQSPKRVHYVDKGSFGSTQWKDYQDVIGVADEVWMCGFCTDICVSANFQVIKAFYPEIPIVVIEDACAGVTPELHKAALSVMGSCQARVKTWEDLKNDEA